MQQENLFVGMFDILGFSKLVMEQPFMEALRKLESLVRLARWSATVPVLGPRGVVNEEVPYVLFSDTLLCWSRDDRRDVDSFLSACAELHARAFEADILLRGAIAYGECSIRPSDHIYVGRPIVWCTALEKCQDWFGTALHRSCLEAPNAGPQIGRMDSVCGYAIPIKPGHMEDEASRLAHAPLAIKWTDRTQNAVGKLESMHASGEPSTQEKIAHTLQFARHVASLAPESGRDGT